MPNSTHSVYSRPNHQRSVLSPSTTKIRKTVEVQGWQPKSSSWTLPSISTRSCSWKGASRTWQSKRWDTSGTYEFLYSTIDSRHLHRIYLEQCEYFRCLFSGDWSDSTSNCYSLTVEDEHITFEGVCFWGVYWIVVYRDWTQCSHRCTRMRFSLTWRTSVEYWRRRPCLVWWVELNRLKAETKWVNFEWFYSRLLMWFMIQTRLH